MADEFSDGSFAPLVAATGNCAGKAPGPILRDCLCINRRLGGGRFQGARGEYQRGGLTMADHKHYGMVIDLRRCVGCHACTVTCKMENSVPDDCFRSWVMEADKGSY